MKPSSINIYKKFQWSWVAELAKLPALTELFYNAHKEDYADLDLREILIAKLPRLMILNRCDISEVERRSSEIRFLNKFGVLPITDEHEHDIERLCLCNLLFFNYCNSYKFF